VETVDPLVIAAAAAQGFLVLQCRECAEKIRAALIAAGYHGKVVTIKCGRRDFILCLSYDGGKETITLNGQHIGVLVGGRVFDNLHPDGVLFENWLADFEGFGGISLVSETDF
jgi:Papain fold toxin 2